MNIDIRLSLGFLDHPKTRLLRKRLGDSAVLCLLRLWMWAAGNKPDGIINMDSERVELTAEWDGEDGAFVKVLLECGWLDETPEGYALHDWEEHQAYASKSEERHERAKKAAQEKWSRPSLDQANRQTRAERLSSARQKATHTEEEWEQMKTFFGNTCVRCGASQVELVKDHIVPLYQGGCDGIKNIQPLCRACNSSKGPETQDFREQYCLSRGLKMPARFSKNACERLHDACENLKNVCGTPTPRHQDSKIPKHQEINTPLSPHQGESRTSVSPARKTPAYPEDFETFWREYPKKTGKDAALRAWQNKKREKRLPDLPELIPKLQAAKQSDQWQRDGGQYIPNPSTWINQARWLDEMQETTQREPLFDTIWDE